MPDDKFERAKHDTKLLGQFITNTLGLIAIFQVWVDKHGPVECCQISKELVKKADEVERSMITLLTEAHIFERVDQEVKDMARALLASKDEEQSIAVLKAFKVDRLNRLKN